MQCLYLSTGQRSGSQWLMAPAFHAWVAEWAHRMTTCWFVQETLPVDPPAIIRGEVVTVADVEALSPDLIVVETRLYESGTMRLPWSLLERLLSQGAQLLLLNVRDPAQYEQEPRDLLGTRMRVEGRDSFLIREERTYNTIAHNPAFISTDVAKMQLISAQYRDAYDDVRAIGCRGAYVLEPWSDVLATAEPTARAQSTSGHWRPDVDWLVFATVRSWGLGHVVVICGDMTSDDVLQEVPANLRFFENLVVLLSQQTSQKSDGARRVLPGRASPVNAPEDALARLELDDAAWAAAMAWINHRRVLIERRLRRLVRRNLEAVAASGGRPWRAAVLAALPSERRQVSTDVPDDALLDSLYWIELGNIISREWRHFESDLKDKRRVQLTFQIVNDRPDAHAKPVDLADFALQRRELLWLDGHLSGTDSAG